MKFNKKAIVSLGTIASISLPLISTIACGNSGSERKFDRDYNFSSIWTHVSNYKDVTIQEWIDGDTLRVEYQDQTVEKLRLESIDTPESHMHSSTSDSGWVDTTGIEHEFAIKAFEFGKHEMPAGSTVRLFMTSELTYGRRVVSLFYGDNFSKSYSVEIIKRGLALPFLPSVLYLKMKRESSSLHYTGVPIADAYNYSKGKKLGMFSMDPAEISKIHGVTDTSNVEYQPNNKATVYHYMDIDYWKE